MADSRHTRRYPSIASEAGRLMPFGDGYPSGRLTGRSTHAVQRRWTDPVVRCPGHHARTIKTSRVDRRQRLQWRLRYFPCVTCNNRDRRPCFWRSGHREDVVLPATSLACLRLRKMVARGLACR